MNVRVELYLRDRVIAGVLPPYTGRALDLFNDPRQDALILHDVSDQQLSSTAAPRMCTAARVQLANVLLVIPHDNASSVEAFLRGWWVEKLPKRAELAIGPFTVIGVLHHWLREPFTLHEIGRTPDQRLFVPVTAAILQHSDQASQSKEYATVFARRTAIDMISLVPDMMPAVGSSDLETSTDRQHASA